MRSFLALVHARLSQRPDSEHGQALVRIAVLSVVLLYLLLRPVHSSDFAVRTGYVLVLQMVAVGFSVGAFLIGWIVLRPGVSHVRRAIGMVSDYGLMAAAMIQLGEPLAWVYVIILWVTIGNGLRFGNRYLFAAVAAAVASLAPCWLSATIGHATSTWAWGCCSG
jgi:two-component system, sensor histidine kinase RpfC